MREAAATHLVGLVIELRIYLVDLFLLLVVEGSVQLIDVELFPPLLRVGEHDLGFRQVELARSQEPSAPRCELMIPKIARTSQTHRRQASSCEGGGPAV